MAAGDMEILKWIASFGVGGILAYAMFQIHRKDTREWLSVVSAQRDAWREQAGLLLQVVKENSQTIALNTSATKQNTDMLVIMKGEILDAFARAGQIDRRDAERSHQQYNEHERRHRT